MKFVIPFLALVLCVNVSFAQEAEAEETIASLKSKVNLLEKEIRKTATDEETLKLFEAEKEMSGKLRARKDELLKEDEKYQNLVTEMGSVRVAKMEGLRKLHPEYNDLFNQIEQMEMDKQKKKEAKDAEYADRIAMSKKRKADAAKKKEAIAKKKAEMMKKREELKKQKQELDKIKGN